MDSSRGSDRPSSPASCARAALRRVENEQLRSLSWRMWTFSFEAIYRQTHFLTQLLLVDSSIVKF